MNEKLKQTLIYFSLIIFILINAGSLYFLAVASQPQLSIGVSIVGILLLIVYWKKKSKKVIYILAAAVMFPSILAILPFNYPYCGYETSFFNRSGDVIECECLGFKKEYILGGEKRCVGIRRGCYIDVNVSSNTGSKSKSEMLDELEKKADYFRGYYRKGDIYDIVKQTSREHIIDESICDGDFCNQGTSNVFEYSGKFPVECDK